MATNNNKVETPQVDNDEISFKEIFFKIKEGITFLISKWKIIFIAGFIGAISGLLIVFNEKPTYKAVLTFAMEEEKGSSLSGAAGIASSFGIDLGGASGGGAFAASNLAELMKSRLIVEKVLLKPVQIKDTTISLAEYYIQINDLRKNWLNNPSLKGIQFLPNVDQSTFTFLQDSLLQKIYYSLIDPVKLTIMQKDKKVSILSIEVTSKDELFSKIFCENLAKETSEFYIETKSKKAKINANVLQTQTDSVRNALNVAISDVANETDNIYNLNPAYNIKGAPSKKRQIDVQSNVAIFTNLLVQLELAKVALRKETPLIQFIDMPILPLDKKKFGKLKALVLGGILTSFLAVLFLIVGEFYKKMLE
jgi:uncharacterized protein involved in exopolysaccharide biosynthesis